MRCDRNTYNKIDNKVLRCGSVSDGVLLKLMHQTDVISEKTFPSNFLRVKNVSCKELLIGDFLDTFNLKIKFLNNCVKILKTFFRYSKIP